MSHARRVLLLIAVSSVGLLHPADAASLVLTCEYKSSVPPAAGDDVPSPPLTYVVDLDNQTIRTDYAAAPRIRYSVDARITQAKIEWTWNTTGYVLDRVNGLLTVRNRSLTFIWQCRAG